MDKTVKLTGLLLLSMLLFNACAAPGSAVSTTPAGSTPTDTTTLPQVTTTPSTVTTPPATTTTPPTATIPAIPTGVSIGNLAPDFELKTLTGENITLSSLRGKPVLLNFWATWCPPCKAEMPFLQQINDTWKPKGLVILEVDVGEKKGQVETFMTGLNLSMQVALDTDMKVTSKSYLIGAIPTTFFIDKNGVIRQKNVGGYLSRAAIEAELPNIMP